MKEEIKEICKDLLAIRNELALDNLDDNTLFDAAVRIFNSGYRKSESKEEQRKPTEKQIKFLKEHGFEGSFDTLTFDEATLTISELIENMRGKKG